MQRNGGWAMLTDLQVRKLTRRFSVSDVDHDGVLTQADFERFVRNYTAVRGWAPGSTEYLMVENNILSWWRSIMQLADPSKDGQVTLQEWLDYHDRLLAMPGGFMESIGRTLEPNIRAFDLDGDGAWNADDYRAFLQVLEIRDADPVAGFQQLDTNGDGLLANDEVMQRLGEFYTSDDPQAPGNVLIGPY
jgi:Ca2+-binding EF-hand superfamily protein